MSHEPDKISRTFEKHCFKCGAWNEVTVHHTPKRVQKSIPYFCADCGRGLGTERGFRISVKKDPN